jgi:hypothetical protein
MRRRRKTRRRREGMTNSMEWKWKYRGMGMFWIKREAPLLFIHYKQCMEWTNCVIS